MTAVTISARQESRWRCGVEHTPAAVSYEAGHWTDDQLAQLRADPLLVVVDGAGAAAAVDAAVAAEASAIPTTPTVQAALETALKALGRATPEEVRAFAAEAAEIEGVRAALHGESAPDNLIEAAIAVLVLGKDPASWIASGAPHVTALEKALGVDITADQRDQAWESFLANDGKGLTGG